MLPAPGVVASLAPSVTANAGLFTGASQWALPTGTFVAGTYPFMLDFSVNQANELIGVYSDAVGPHSGTVFDIVIDTEGSGADTEVVFDFSVSFDNLDQQLNFSGTIENFDPLRIEGTIDVFNTTSSAVDLTSTFRVTKDEVTIIEEPPMSQPEALGSTTSPQTKKGCHVCVTAFLRLCLKDILNLITVNYLSVKRLLNVAVTS